MGFKTIAGRGKDKAEIVRKLGAIHYIDSRSQNPVDELVKLGGAKIIPRMTFGLPDVCIRFHSK
jgi:D-arabinose 1-dehydrogenase-like Zn-dependent alcohol dehydrogenase